LSKGYAYNLERGREQVADAIASSAIECAYDPGDPFFEERVNGRFLASDLDNIEEPIGHLDWIGGFAEKGCTELEVFATPLLRCIGQTPYTGARCCTAIARVKNSPVLRTRRLGSIARASAGQVISLEKRRAFQVPIHTSVHDPRKSTTWASFVLDIRDELSLCAPFADIRRLRPDLATLISGWCQCPPSVSFYILKSAGLTAVIPTAAILRSCYAPSQLEKYLNAPRRKPSFASETTIFNGYCYTDAAYGLFPTRSARYFTRAEHEVAQLLPRAAAYYQRNHTFAPLLLRPPFTGQVRIQGNSVVWADRRGVVVLFTQGIMFHAPNREVLREDPLTVTTASTTRFSWRSL